MAGQSHSQALVAEAMPRGRRWVKMAISGQLTYDGGQSCTPVKILGEEKVLSVSLISLIRQRPGEQITKETCWKALEIRNSIAWGKTRNTHAICACSLLL